MAFAVLLRLELRIGMAGMPTVLQSIDGSAHTQKSLTSGRSRRRKSTMDRSVPSFPKLLLPKLPKSATTGALPAGPGCGPGWPCGAVGGEAFRSSLRALTPARICNSVDIWDFGLPLWLLCSCILEGLPGAGNLSILGQLAYLFWAAFITGVHALATE